MDQQPRDVEVVAHLRADRGFAVDEDTQRARREARRMAGLLYPPSVVNENVRIRITPEHAGLRTFGGTGAFLGFAGRNVALLAASASTPHASNAAMRPGSPRAFSQRSRGVCWRRARTGCDYTSTRYGAARERPTPTAQYEALSYWRTHTRMFGRVLRRSRRSL